MLARILILDDLFGRNSPSGRNPDRENLCAHFLWKDSTDDTASDSSEQIVPKPTAEVVFCRAQTPIAARIGDIVENDLDAALEAVGKGWPESRDSNSEQKPEPQTLRWSMVLIDLCFYTGLVTEESDRRTSGMPEGRTGDDDPHSYFGLTLLDVIHREFPELPIFILSSKPREEVSLEFSRRGALGFIDRSAPDGPELLQQALWNHGLLPDASGEVVGQSLPMLLALREARRAAGHRENVLLRGETGTGKEEIAKFIHRSSHSAKKATATHEANLRFVVFNSGSLDLNFLATELFGIQPRTATGVDGKVGLIEKAKNGELFLDEILDMPPEVQAALMRVVEERKISRVGSRESIAVDVRFLASTNADLEGASHSLRDDLLDRLRTGGTIWLPPLRDRLEDIPLLAERFVREAESQRPGIRKRKITPEAIDCLKNHDWPNNVRGLRTVLFNAVTGQPDVEYLLKDHLDLDRPERKGRDRTSRQKNRSNHSVGELVSVLDQFDVRYEESTDWAETLPELQRSQARLNARLLEAAIRFNKRPTSKQPHGAIQIHPAAKQLTGDFSLTASKAADLIKRLLRPLEDELEGDLLEAYRISLRLRPKANRRTGKRGRESAAK